MFQAHHSAARADVTYPSDLASLGFHFTSDGSLLNTTTGKVFDFYHTNSERINWIRKEAAQQAVRAHVLEVLRNDHNIHEYYLTADHHVHKEKPKDAHVPILMTEVSELVKKRDVIIVVGNEDQDMGIWAWRTMQDEKFLSKGTAVGLAEELAGWGTTLSSFGEVEHANYAGFEIEVEEVKGDPTPGLIILNPGELCYSPSQNKATTLKSWTHRPGNGPEGLIFHLDPASNSVGDHTTPSEHISTCIKHILPQFIVPSTRTYVITMGDMVPPLLQHLSSVIRTGPAGTSNEAIALIAPPIFDASETITDNCMPTHMAARARAWVDSREKLGELVCVPPMERPDSSTKPRAEMTDEELEGQGEDVVDMPKLPVCCPYFSSGKADGIAETVWTEVMGKVMGWFWDVREEAVKAEGLSRGVVSARRRKEAAGGSKI